LLLILLAAAFLAGRWWSSGDDAIAVPTTSPPVATTTPAAPSDATIQVAVDEAIDALAPSGVVADVTDGVVMLSGSVPEAATRQALSDVVSDIAGVREIDNRVDVAVIEPPTPEEIQAAADAARTATGLEHLNVSVADGVATITGVVTVEAVENGVFASIAPLREALSAINGIDTTVTRVQLRGDEAALRGELKALIDEAPIIFESGSPDLDEVSIATLDRAADIIMSFPGLRVLIAGHTDAAGATEQNEALAAARGQVVLGYLLSRGVPITRLQVVSYGELFPEAGAEQSLNRRIEFEVAP
jgi:outer membrane protein OmpA-like peptidoglycan-associated protein